MVPLRWTPFQRLPLIHGASKYHPGEGTYDIVMNRIKIAKCVIQQQIFTPSSTKHTDKLDILVRWTNRNDIAIGTSGPSPGEREKPSDSRLYR